MSNYCVGDIWNLQWKTNSFTGVFTIQLSRTHRWLFWIFWIIIQKPSMRFCETCNNNDMIHGMEIHGSWLNHAWQSMRCQPGQKAEIVKKWLHSKNLVSMQNKLWNSWFLFNFMPWNVEKIFKPYIYLFWKIWRIRKWHKTGKHEISKRFRKHNSKKSLRKH